MDDTGHSVGSEAWGGVTSPGQHQEGYRYLVHAINPFARLNALKVSQFMEEDGIAGGARDASQGDQSINLFDHPERIGDRVSLSLSMIDDEHRATWGQAGLIVEVPEANVLITQTTDVGSATGYTSELERQAQKHYRMPPDDLLRFSTPTQYNEVVVRARTDAGEARVVGFFAKVDLDGTFINPQLADNFATHAARLALPLVRIKEIGLFEKDAVERWKGSIAVTKGGKRYLLKPADPGAYDLGFSPAPAREVPPWQSRFLAISATQSSFMSPSELEIALRDLRSDGGSHDEIATLRREYREIDGARQQGTVERNDDGTFKSIASRSGYGNAEEEVRIGLHNGHGSAWCTNIKEQSDRIAAAFAGSGIMKIGEDRANRAMSSHEVRQVFKSAVASGKLSPDEATGVLDQVLTGVERQWEGERLRSSLGQRRSFGSGPRLLQG